MPLSRTQRDILKAMHRLRKPSTVNEISTMSHITWITVDNNLKILLKQRLVFIAVIKTKKTTRKLWRLNYAIFED